VKKILGKNSSVCDSVLQTLRKNSGKKLEAMATVYDVAVIGAGLFGSSCAKWASEDTEAAVLIGPSEEAKVRLNMFGAWFDEGRITEMADSTHNWRILGRTDNSFFLLLGLVGRRWCTYNHLKKVPQKWNDMYAHAFCFWVVVFCCCCCGSSVVKST
jgi:hypothetical protein